MTLSQATLSAKFHVVWMLYRPYVEFSSVSVGVRAQQLNRGCALYASRSAVCSANQPQYSTTWRFYIARSISGGHFQATINGRGAKVDEASVQGEISFLSVKCFSSIGQIIKLVCVCESLSHQTSVRDRDALRIAIFHRSSPNCHQGRVPEDVLPIVFWWKSEIFMSAKPEMELIVTTGPM